MRSRILIAGGYGLIGSTFARQLRSLSPEAELILAGRNPEKGAALARELDCASTAALDVAGGTGLDALASADLVVSALYDPANTLALEALRRGVAHIGITTKVEDVAPIAFAALRSAPKRPIVLLGHCTAGVATIVAQKAAQRFRRVDAIAVAALYDARDPVGPMTAGDAEMLVTRALLRQAGLWKWVEGPQHARAVRLNDDTMSTDTRPGSWTRPAWRRSPARPTCGSTCFRATRSGRAPAVPPRATSTSISRAFRRPANR